MIFNTVQRSTSTWYLTVGTVLLTWPVASSQYWVTSSKALYQLHQSHTFIVHSSSMQNPHVEIVRGHLVLVAVQP